MFPKSNLAGNPNRDWLAAHRAVVLDIDSETHITVICTVIFLLRLSDIDWLGIRPLSLHF